MLDIGYIYLSIYLYSKTNLARLVSNQPTILAIMLVVVVVVVVVDCSRGGSDSGRICINMLQNSTIVST